MLLPDNVQDEVRELWQDLSTPVEVRVFDGSGDPSANETMKALWQELSALNPHVKIAEGTQPMDKFLPERDQEREGPVSELWVNGAFTGVRYLGIPSGHEFGGLVDTIRALASNAEPHISQETRIWLEQLDQDLHLEVFVTPTCPYCPQAVRLAQEMARINPDRIMADMVDCSTFSRLATRLNVMGVPMTLINGHERITGAAPEAQVMDAIRESLPQSL